MPTTTELEQPMLKYPIKETHQACFGTSLDDNAHVFMLQAFDGNQAIAGLPTVLCAISADQHCLNVTFVVQAIPTSIDIPTFGASRACHTDFLWEQNCLEIFLTDKHSAYYEVNASLDGSFAMYEFDGYRNPATLPPKKSEALRFEWRNVDTGSALIHQFSLFFSAQTKFSVNEIVQVNPCAIFYLGTSPLFYAVNHANPPDFHDRQFWSTV